MRKVATLLRDPNSIAGLHQQSTRVILAQIQLQQPKAAESKRGKMQTCVSMWRALGVHAH